MSLPLLFIAFTGIYGLGLANIGLGFLFLGQVVALPMALAITHFIFSILLYILPFLNPLLTRPYNDICNLIPGTIGGNGETIVAPSVWISQLFLFMTYLFANAFSVYTMESTASDTTLVANRTSRSLSAMIIIGTITFILLLLRQFVVGKCETTTGTIMGMLVGVGFGIGWYNLAMLCGAQNADIFGIVAGILPTSATAPAPTYCAQTS
jgi:hypothetical protein